MTVTLPWRKQARGRARIQVQIFDSQPCSVLMASQMLCGRESASNSEDSAWIPGLGRSPREGNGNSLQYSCLENPMDRGARWAAVHEVAKSCTRLSD